MVMYILLVVLLSITLTHSFPQWTPSRPVRPRLGAPFGDRRNQTRFTPGPNPPLLDRPIHHVDLSKDCGYIRHTNTEPYGTEGTHALGKCNLGLTAKRTGRDEEGWAVASPGVGWGLEAHPLDSGWSLLWALGWSWSILRLSMGP